MTPEQAIRAGGLALTRKELRQLALIGSPARLVVRTPTGDRILHLDARATRAALEGADLEMSDRLQKLGVSEYDPQLIAAPVAEQPAPRSGRSGRRPSGTLGVRKPPKEPA